MIEADGMAERTAVRELLRQRRQAWVRRSLSGGPAAPGRPTAATEQPTATDPFGTHDCAPSLSAPKWSVDVAAVERQRIIRGWSRLELAGTAHVDPKTLRDLVGQRRRPNLGTVQAVCTALGMTLTDVIRFS